MTDSLPAATNLNNLKYLHIHSGDTSAKPLRDSNIPGDVYVWREIYIEGPVPGYVAADEFRKIRAEFLSNSMTDLDYGAVLKGINDGYDLLTEAGKYEEVIIWVDYCMFCQTIMLHVIDQCAKQKWIGKTKLSLIYFEPGALSSEKLAALMNSRHVVTQEEINLAHKAWKAFASANPTGIENILAGDCSALPYLRDAFVRHLEQYPSVRNGLNRTQNQILQAITDGATKLTGIFKTVVHDMEKQPFMGDTSLWTVIIKLAEADVPLLKISGPEFSELTNINPENYAPPSAETLQKWNISITDAGKKVFESKQDFIRLNGIDHWLGGVQLQGAKAQWRWDEDKRKLIEL
jgi:hypothetical protein